MVTIILKVMIYNNVSHSCVQHGCSFEFSCLATIMITISIVEIPNKDVMISQSNSKNVL